MHTVWTMRSSHGSQVTTTSVLPSATTCPGINNVTRSTRRPRVLWASSDGHFMLLPHPWRREHMKHWWGRPWSMRQPHGHLTPRLRSRRSNRCRDPRLASSKLTTDGPLASHQWLMPWSGTRSPFDASSTTPPYSTRSTTVSWRLPSQMWWCQPTPEHDTFIRWSIGSLGALDWRTRTHSSSEWSQSGIYSQKELSPLPPYQRSRERHTPYFVGCNPDQWCF